MRVRVHDGRVVAVLTKDGRWVSPCSVLKTARGEERSHTGSVTLADLEKIVGAPPQSLAEENRRHSDSLAATNKRNRKFWGGAK